MKPWPWPEPPTTDRHAHLTKGTPIPDVTLKTHDGQDIAPARLPGRHLLIVYPWTGGGGLSDPPDWDNIPGAHGSTAELLGFRNLILAFKTIELGLIGLATQSRSEQAAFASRSALPFPLISDADGAFAGPLGLATFTTGGRDYFHRVTLVVRDGKIEHVFDPVHPPDTHARELVYWASATEPKRADGKRRSS